MNAQFHTPSFGDELVYDVPDIDTSGTGGVSNTNISTSYIQPQQQQLQSKRMRSMDQSLDEYHSANDESFGNSSNVGAATSSADAVTPTTPTTSTATLAARKQLSSSDSNEPAKPLSAYGLFFRDTVSAIKQQNPNCTFQELSRIVASMWEALDVSHKNVYNKKHEMALNEYVKQMRAYRQHMEQQQQEQLIANEGNNTLLQTKPAVFTISRFNADATNNETNALSNPVHTANAQLQPQKIQNTLVGSATVQQNNTTNVGMLSSNPSGAATAAISQPLMSTTTDPSPPQMQMLTEAGAVQKCTRENCNKRAIINPDWEDEYCSNECVVIHCRNVFNAWVQSNLESRKQ